MESLRDSFTRQLAQRGIPAMTTNVKLEHKQSEEGFVKIPSDFDSPVEEDATFGKNHDSSGQLTQAEVKRFNMVTPDLVDVNLAADNVGRTVRHDWGDAVVIDGDKDVVHRWRQMGAVQDLHSDCQIAAFLLERYEESRARTSKSCQLCTWCHTPLTLVCLSCSPTQARHEEDKSLSQVYNDAEQGTEAILQEISSDDDDNDDNDDDDDDDDDDVPFTTDTSDSSIWTAEAKAVGNDVGLLQEKETEHSSTAFSAGVSEDSRTDGEVVKKVAVPPTGHQISENCFVKVVDIASEQAVRRLQEKGLLTTGEVETLKMAEDMNKRRAALTMKIKLKRSKVSDNTDNVFVHKQTDRDVSYKENGNRGKNKVSDNTDSVFVHKQTDTGNRGDGVRVKRRRGRPRKEHVAGMLENKGVVEKLFKCSVCCKTFRNRSNCQAHQFTHVGDRKPHKCDHCPAAFRSYANLKAHCRKHTGERPFSCELCGKSFARSTTLEQHKRVHTNDRPYKCEECGETFKQRGMVIVHRRKAHTFERPFSCNVCGANFVVKGHLQVHMQSHTGVRPFLCEECGASFKQKGILKTHKMIHKGIRPFSCDICNKSFYRQVDVRAHKKTHFNIRNIICNVCGAAFGNNGTLKRHMQKHTGFRPFKCSECEKNFASNSELKVHQRIHSGHKPYVCDVCERGFQTMGNMKKHRKNRHKTAPPYVPPKPKMGAQMQEDQRINLFVSSLPSTGLFSSENNKEVMASVGQKTQPMSSGSCVEGALVSVNI